MGDDEEEDEEEDDQPAQIEKLPDATTCVPVTEVTKDRRRGQWLVCLFFHR